MRVRVHRGCHEIGGSCIEVESAAGYRLVLDIGKPLTAERGEHVPLPSVPGLAEGDDPSLLGVLVTHGHLDHYGLIDQVSPRVPVFSGRAAAAIVNAARFFSPGGPELVPTTCYEDGVPLQLGPFTVTPFLVDHSAFDAYSLLIAADGERLFYTGDLRGHGRKSALFDRLLAMPPVGVDTLLMEGTHVRAAGDDVSLDDAKVLTESAVELEMAATFRRTAGTAMVMSSSQNIDRLVTVYRAARRAGRTLVMDLYTATIAEATGRPSIPRPGFPGVAVYVPQRQRVLVKQSGEFHRTEIVRPRRIFAEQLLADPSRYVMLAPSSAAGELLRDGVLDGGIAIWSLWSGYLAEPSGVRLVEQLRAAGVEFVKHHTSGHAPIADLRRLVQAIKPARLVPIHTEGSSQYAAHFGGTTAHSDGDWWPVGRAVGCAPDLPKSLATAGILPPKLSHPAVTMKT